MAAIGGILAGICGIGMLVMHIIAIVKCFKAGDTLWGVLTIFLGITGLIWLFMNNEKKLGKIYVGLLVGYLIAVGLLVGGGLMQMPVQ